jgi:hypothetical protein
MRRPFFYEPLPSQWKFHKSEARFKGFSGPIGSGKSQALCQEAILCAYLNPRCMGLVGAPTYPMLKDATLPALLRALEEAKVRFEHNKSENTIWIEEVEARILLRSVDDYERLRGTNLAWFGIDELTYTAEEAWLRLEGRLREPRAKRMCGFGVWTPKGYDWVYRRFIRDRVEGYDCIQAQPFENRHLLKNTPDFYERLKRSYDEGFFAQEVLGEYTNPAEGLVYRAFDRRQNVREAEADPRLPLCWALDFNVNPMSSVVAQVDGGEVQVVDEIVLKRAGTLDACREFTRRYPRAEAGLKIYADASAARMQTAGASDEDVLRDYFARHTAYRVEYRLARSNPSVKSRVEAMNAMLRAYDGERRLFVAGKCGELIKDFEEVTFVGETYEIDKKKDPRRTHLSDALGYLVWREFGWKKTWGEQREPLTCQ